MRFIQFYSGIESFNYFTSQLARELLAEGHETFIYDLLNPQPMLQGLTDYCRKGVDAVLVFDGLGIHEDLYWQLWNQMEAVIVNILMDPPYRFHPMLESCQIRKYVLFCPDQNHVKYVKRYFPQIEHVEFLPHPGSECEKGMVPFEERSYDLLFSGTYYQPERYVPEIFQAANSDDRIYQIYMQANDRMIADTSLTVEGALEAVLGDAGLQLSEGGWKALMRGSDSLDWKIRMYFREKVISSLIENGIDTWIVGRGWHNHPCAGAPCMHILTEERIPFADTLDLMRDAKINLNVMPWFKAGTHDRIFNAMLRQSVVLTDPSRFLTEVYQDGEDICFYSLDFLEQLPAIVHGLLENPERSLQIAKRGFQKTKELFTWKEYAGRILKELHSYAGR